MLSSRSVTVGALLYAALCVALVLPATAIARGAPYIFGYVLGTAVSWLVIAAVVAGIAALVSRGDARRTNAQVNFNVTLAIVATVSVLYSLSKATP